MTFTNTFETAAFINKTHSRFAGRTTAPKLNNPHSFNQLMRARDYIRKEPACTSVTFDAVMDYCGSGPVNTEITLEPTGKDGWIYIERPVH